MLRSYLRDSRARKATLAMAAILATSVGTTVGSGHDAGVTTSKQPSRVIVKLRGAHDQGLSLAASSSTGAIDLDAASAADPAAADLLRKHAVRGARPLYAARSARRQMGVSDAQIASQSRQRFATRTARAAQVARLPDLAGTYVLDLGPLSREELDQTLAALRAEPGVIYAEEDKVVQISYVPNDPYYSSSGSWGQPYDDLYGLRKIGTTQAWDTARGDGALVAVIDTGIDYNHPDVNDNVWINADEIPGNGLDDDGNGYIDDRRGWDFVGATAFPPAPDNDPYDGHWQGHGTHVAGTIAAEGDNGTGVVGVAWKARVMAVKGLDDFGSGLDSGLANAIVYAADNGADIINASWGGQGTSQTIKNAVDYAHGLGVVFVAAAGNSNQDASGHYPANLTNAITVAAIDAFDQKAYFSNYGNKIDVAAPGVDILSLQRATGGYFRLQGTSMAAPHVSGVAALVVQRHPEFTSEQIRQVLRSSATDLGAPGKDNIFGYGRVSAAQAVLVDQVLEAQIVAPTNGTAVRAPTTLTGTARGPGFDHYVVEFGSGESPTTWTTIQTSSVPVTAGNIGTFDPSTLSDGPYTVRLRAVTTGGRAFSDQIRIDVRYLEFTSPVPSPVVSLTHLAKAGTTIPIAGRAVGPSFQRYRLDWAFGRDATSGWSTAGITLTNGGVSPVIGSLGEWVTPAFMSGPHTLRLVVENAGFSSESFVNVYLETSLASSIWPQFVLHSSAGYESPVPVRHADGSTRLVVCGAGHLDGAGECRSFYDYVNGFSTGVRLSTLSVSAPPSAGNLDPAPGEEVLVADGSSLQIFSADLSSIRTITTPRAEQFVRDMTTLADLDGDGIHEILALGRNGWWGAPELTGSLHVYRASGQLYSSRYPLAIVPPAGSSGQSQVNTLAVDLNGDGRKEILLAIHNSERTQYVLRAYNADGTVFAAWPTPSFQASSSWPPVAADLDRDGSMEILTVDGTPGSGELPRLRVLNSNGTTRPGWPVAVNVGFGLQHSGGYSIGDLDRDQRDEIAVSVRGGVQVFRHDGSQYGFFDFFSWDFPGHSVIADIDNDTYPDVLVRYEQISEYRGVIYHDLRFRGINHNGFTIKEWPIFGMQGRQAARAAVAVGDFTGDGVMDIAVRHALVEGGGAGGGIAHGAFMMWDIRIPFRPASVDWPLYNHDPQNGRVRPVPTAPPTARLGPVADAHVRDGGSAGSNFGTAASLDVKTTSTTGNNRIAYLRFPLGGLGSNVVSARLRLHGRGSDTTVSSDSVYAVSNNTWSETGITWNNKPALGTKQGESLTVTSIAQYHEWDVTAFVRAQKTGGATAVSLAVKMDTTVSDSPDTFSSREAASNRPELVVTLAPDTVTPEADAYVRDGTSAGANFGGAASLDVKTTSTTGNNRTAYLRFPLAVVGSKVTSAKLRLYGHGSNTTASTDSAYAVSSNTWSQTGVTWNNKPALGAKLGASVAVTSTAQYYEWDVTVFVRSQKTAGAAAVSLAVKMDQQVGDSPDTFNSKEATANRPQLVVTSGP